MKKQAATVAALTAATALALTAVPAQAAPAGEIIGYPGPDGLIWIAEQAGSSGFVSGGLSPHLDTFITFGCAGGGTIEVDFRLSEHPDRSPAPFALACPATDPARVTLPLGTGLRGGFVAWVTTSTPTTRWGATVTQPE